MWEKRERIFSCIISTLVALLLCIFLVFYLKPHFFCEEKLINKISDLKVADLSGYELDNGLFKIKYDPFYMYFKSEGTYDRIRIQFDAIQLPMNVKLYYTVNGKYSDEAMKCGKIDNKQMILDFNNDSSGFIDGRNAFMLRIGDSLGQTFSIKSIEVYKSVIHFNRINSLTLIGLFLLLSNILYAVCKFLMNLQNTKISKVLLIAIMLTLYFYLTCYITQGDTFKYVFSSDASNIYMDFFSSLDITRYKNPYLQFSNYPAMALLFYKILFWTIPKSLVGNNGFDLRITQIAELEYMLMTIFLLFTILSLMNRNEKFSIIEKKLFNILILASAPIIFTIERGNIILVAFVLTLFFCEFYESKSNLLKNMAYFSLGMAAAIKIYPAIFGLLLIKKGKWKDLLVLGSIGIFCFFAPFIFFGGIGGIKTMINALCFSSESSQTLGYGLNVSIKTIILVLADLLNWKILLILADKITIILFLVLLCLFFIMKEKKYKLLILSLFVILIPTMSFYYTCIFLFIPLLNFFKEELKEKLDNVMVLMMLGIVIPFPFKLIEEISISKKFVFSYTMLGYDIILISILMLIIIKSMTLIIKSYK